MGRVWDSGKWRWCAQSWQSWDRIDPGLKKQEQSLCGKVGEGRLWSRERAAPHLPKRCAAQQAGGRNPCPTSSPPASECLLLGPPWSKHPSEARPQKSVGPPSVSGGHLRKVWGFLGGQRHSVEYILIETQREMKRNTKV